MFTPATRAKEGAILPDLSGKYQECITGRYLKLRAGVLLSKSFLGYFEEGVAQEKFLFARSLGARKNFSCDGTPVHFIVEPPKKNA